MVADLAADQEDLRRLRAQLAEYEQIFRTAAPRLAAFRKLEEVAREQSKTPAAVAAEAAFVMLTAECRGREDELRRLASECSDRKDELTRLSETRNQIAAELEEIRAVHADLYADVAEILNELELLRTDAERLLSERGELENQVEALRAEAAGLRSRRADDVPPGPDPMAGPDAPTTHTGGGFDLDNDDEKRRFDDFFHADVEHDKARDWILG